MNVTLAVQSFNMTPESSPLEANAVGQLLPCVNTEQLHAFSIGIKHLLILLGLSLTMTVQVFLIDL